MQLSSTSFYFKSFKTVWWWLHPLSCSLWEDSILPSLVTCSMLRLLLLGHRMTCSRMKHHHQLSWFFVSDWKCTCFSNLMHTSFCSQKLLVYLAPLFRPLQKVLIYWLIYRRHYYCISHHGWCVLGVFLDGSVRCSWHELLVGVEWFRLPMLFSKQLSNGPLLKLVAHRISLVTSWKTRTSVGGHLVWVRSRPDRSTDETMKTMFANAFQVNDVTDICTIYKDYPSVHFYIITRHVIFMYRHSAKCVYERLISQSRSLGLAFNLDFLLPGTSSIHSGRVAISLACSCWRWKVRTPPSDVFQRFFSRIDVVSSKVWRWMVCVVLQEFTETFCISSDCW